MATQDSKDLYYTSLELSPLVNRYLNSIYLSAHKQIQDLPPEQWHTVFDISMMQIVTDLANTVTIGTYCYFDRYYFLDNMPQFKDLDVNKLGGNYWREAYPGIKINSTHNIYGQSKVIKFMGIMTFRPAIENN
jgi:hypothetical protein